MSPRKSENPDLLSSAVADRANRLSPSGIRKFFDLLASMDDVISLGVGEPEGDGEVPLRVAAVQALGEIGSPRIQRLIDEAGQDIH